MSVAFNGTENAVLTFEVGTVTAGYTVAMSANNKVANATSGDAVVGILLNKRNGFGAVQVRGYAEVSYSGDTAPSLGFNELVADGSGGVRLVGNTESGRAYLVVNLDTTNKIAGLFL